MNKKEAIKEIEQLINNGVALKTTTANLPRKSVEALETAIEALQERPKGRWIELPCEIGDTVYLIEPLIYGIWDNKDHPCRKCKNFYEGGMGDLPDCLAEKRCYHIIKEVADFRMLGDWLTPSRFTGKIEWGETVFLTKEEAEKALADMRESE